MKIAQPIALPPAADPSIRVTLEAEPDGEDRFCEALRQLIANARAWDEQRRKGQEAA